MTATGRDTSISVVICAYTNDRWDDLCAAVDSMRKQTVPPNEVILVVDHNPELLARVRADLPDVTAIENAESKGLSGARNSGVAAARGSLIAFLDDDATADPDWLAWLSRSCEPPQVLGASGRSEPNWVAKAPAWFPQEFYWVLGCTYRGLPTTVSEVRNLYGGCACVKREVFETVGGFRTGIGRSGNRPLGGEETELCIRARQRWPESTFVFQPRAVIHHKVTPERATWRYYRARCFFEGLSKAHIAGLVGSKDGLSSERNYTFRTLPQGVLRGLGDALLRGEVHGLQRAGAIVGGLAITTVGFLSGKVRGAGRVERPRSYKATPVERDTAL
jgi:GT2 family glycosyltransferase